MKTISLAEAPAVIREHFKAVNDLDLDAILATFSEDAYVNDNRREIRGPAALRAFFAKEFVGDSVSVEPVEVVEHHGDVIVRGRYDGTYDKTTLPEVLVMSNYFALRDGQIVALAVIFNQPSPYGEPGE
jgi:hypothetical protein